MMRTPPARVCGLISEPRGGLQDPHRLRAIRIRSPCHAAESGRLASSCRPVMGVRFNCVGAWSCLRRAGLPRSLLSPPGEAFWPSGPMDHGVQRRERGGGQAAGPAARPELAAPSGAAVPREIPTCSASLPLPAFRSASRRLLQAVPLPVFFDAFSARLARGYAAAGPLAFSRATRGAAP